MTLHLRTPFALDKNLGRAYNETLAAVGDDDWVCLLDHDVLLLTPDAVPILHRYAELVSGPALLTCYTNRVSPLSTEQLRSGTVSENADLLFHIGQAQRQKSQLYTVSVLERHLSGFLMLLPKRLWREHPFTEDLKCLGVDTEYRERLQAAHVPILRMNGLYVWHTYRLTAGIHSKKHLL